MSIRVKCQECGSVLKVKDELAGTEGKCPKCKTKFTIPEADQPQEADAAEAPSDDASAAETDGASEKAAVAAATAAKKKTKPEKGKAAAESSRKAPPKDSDSKPAAADDDFDPAAFLMDDSSPGAKASAGLTTPEPSQPKPVTDSRGRRHIAPPPPTPSKPGDSPAAASAAAAMNASANARDLLSKHRDDSRTKASTMPGAPPAAKPKIDYAAASRSALPAAGGVVGVVVVAYLLYMIVSYFMGPRLPLPELAEVTGTVTLNGQPVRDAIVRFMPVQNKGVSTSGKEIRLRTAEGVTDENGYYEIYYMPGHPGAPVNTKVRLAVRPQNYADYGRFPAEYLPENRGNDIREIKAAGNSGKFNIELKTNN